MVKELLGLREDNGTTGGDGRVECLKHTVTVHGEVQVVITEKRVAKADWGMTSFKDRRSRNAKTTVLERY